MTDTRVDYEMPFKGVNGAALRAALVATFPSALDESDISIVYGRGHPQSYSDSHVVGIVVAIDPANVTQSDVDTATQELSSALGASVRELGWGSHEPDYLDQ